MKRPTKGRGDTSRSRGGIPAQRAEIPPRVVEFFYAGTCPWAYLAAERLREIAIRNGVRVRYRPILQPGVAGEDAILPPAWAAQSPAVAAYASADLAAWARYCGVRIEMPARWPVDARWVQRGAVLAAEVGTIESYSQAIFRALFQEGRDVGDRNVVAEIATGSGVPRASLDGKLAADSTQEALHEHYAALLDAGGFTSPTMLLDRTLYVGHDRTPLLEFHLLRLADRPFLPPGDHSR